MAFVFGVIAFRTASTEILYVNGSGSASTSFNPSSATTSTVAIKVKLVVMTSSPGFRPRAIIAICRASVPLAHEITWPAPRYFRRSSSNCLTSGPLMKTVEVRTDLMALSISGANFPYWAFRSTISISLIRTDFSNYEDSDFM